MPRVPFVFLVFALLVGGCSKAPPETLAERPPQPAAALASTDRATSPPPVGEEARRFTERFIDFVHEAHPTVTLAMTGDFTVTLEGGGRMDLRNLWYDCRTPATCDQATARYADVLLGLDDRAITAERLRLALTSGEMLDRSMPRDAFVYRPWAGDILQVLTNDSPIAITFVTKDALSKTPWSEGKAGLIALENVRRALPERFEGHAIDPVTPNIFVASMPNAGGAALLLIERWAPLAAGGTLLAAAPARDVVVWAQHPTDEEARKLRRVARDLYMKEMHPISPAVLRWRPSGWVLDDGPL